MFISQSWNVSSQSVQLRIVDGAISAAQEDLVEQVLHDVRELHGGDLVDDAAVVVLGWRA